ASPFIFEVTKHRLHAGGSVVLPARIVVQRPIASGRIIAAGVVVERKSSGGGVVTARGQLIASLIAERNVTSTCRIVIKSEHAQSRIGCFNGVLVERDLAVRRVLGSCRIAVESFVTLG